jgi:hypothetical protein
MVDSLCWHFMFKLPPLPCASSEITWCWSAASNVTGVAEVLNGRVSDYCYRHAQRNLVPCEGEWALEEGCCSATCWKAINTVGAPPCGTAFNIRICCTAVLVYCCSAALLHFCTGIGLLMQDVLYCCGLLIQAQNVRSLCRCDSTCHMCHAV